MPHLVNGCLRDVGLFAGFRCALILSQSLRAAFTSPLKEQTRHQKGVRVNALLQFHPPKPARNSTT